MSHGFEFEEQAIEVAEPRPLPGPIGVLEVAMRAVNRAMLILSGIALVAACLVLTQTVVAHMISARTNWQDETAIFLLVGATFLCLSTVQARRGHVGIEALAGLLSPGVNRVRLLAIDLLSFVFLTFFTWKTWHLLHEAWVDGQVTHSSWGPPLWIPYSLMFTGMVLLTLQVLLQIVDALLRREGQR